MAEAELQWKEIDAGISTRLAQWRRIQGSDSRVILCRFVQGGRKVGGGGFENTSHGEQTGSAPWVAADQLRWGALRTELTVTTMRASRSP